MAILLIVTRVLAVEDLLRTIHHEEHEGHEEKAFCRYIPLAFKNTPFIARIFLQIALLSSLAIACYYCTLTPSSSQKSTHSKRGILKRERYIKASAWKSRKITAFLLVNHKRFLTQYFFFVSFVVKNFLTLPKNTEVSALSLASACSYPMNHD
jgi:hypothetical protein